MDDFDLDLWPTVDDMHQPTGEDVKALKRSMGATSKQMASFCGVTYVTWYKWERGHTKMHPMTYGYLQLMRAYLIRHDYDVNKLYDFINSTTRVGF